MALQLTLGIDSRNTNATESQVLEMKATMDGDGDGDGHLKISDTGLENKIVPIFRCYNFSQVIQHIYPLSPPMQECSLFPSRELSSSKQLQDQSPPHKFHFVPPPSSHPHD